jgi:hypothetical protein
MGTKPAGASGWVSCHDLDRPDVHPSARFHPATGRFWNPECGRQPLSLFGLGSALGVYPNWRECMADLARFYLGVRGGGP